MGYFHHHNIGKAKILFTYRSINLKFSVYITTISLNHIMFFFTGENQACKTYSKELGETPSAICREPLKCVRGTCIKVTPRR